VREGRYVLWGSSGHAKVLADIVELQGGRVIALFDNDSAAVGCLGDVPLYYGEAGFHEWLDQQSSVLGIAAGLAIGGNRGKARKQIAQTFESAGLQLMPIVHPSAAVSRSARLGPGSQVLANAVVAADVSIGSVSIVNNSVNVDHECRLGTGVHLAPGVVLCGCVVVEDYVMIGAGAVVLPRLHIGEGAIVGSGAVVTKDIPSGAVVVGNPARPIRG
jgi:sugar O-acyltransferase (sialic acid O-acetyltransferase NeuD family)